MSCPRDGGLLKSYPNFSISLHAFGSNTSLMRTVGRLLLSYSKPLEKVMTPGTCASVILLKSGS